MGRLHTFVVTLHREHRETNWGLRLVGGADLATPLIVTRVTPGTPAGKELLRGDIIAKIDDYDARDLRHEDAQNLFKNAQKHIKLVVQRDVDRVQQPRSASSLAPRSPVFNAASPYRTPSPMPATAFRGPESLPRSTPVPQLSYPPQFNGERTVLLSPTYSIRTDDTADESIGSQPYRTTPLVLPGAKVRREPGPTESYLRHHPNPAMRAPPSHDYRDTLMRQKYVHKQFNSPINLYSDQNIANSIRQQTSPLPANGHYGRPHVVKRQLQADAAVRPRQVRDLPRAAGGGAWRRRAGGARARRDQGLHGAARQEVCAYSQTNETAAGERQQQRKTNDLRKRDKRRAYSAIELFQAPHVQRSRRHGVLAASLRPLCSYNGTPVQ